MAQHLHERGLHNIDVSQSRKLLHICSGHGHPLQVNLQIYWLQLCNCSTCMLIDNFHLTESSYIVVNSCMFTVEASEFPSQNCLHLIINTVQRTEHQRSVYIANW